MLFGFAYLGYMKKIINPERQNPSYNCYGCAPGNSLGLKMEFWDDGDYIVSEWLPATDFQSYNNVLHGGVQMALLDELACWVMMVKLGTAGFTQRMEVDFKKNVFLCHGAITLKARIRETVGDLAYIECYIIDKEGIIRTEALAIYFIYPEKIARKRLHYPGRENFIVE